MTPFLPDMVAKKSFAKGNIRKLVSQKHTVYHKKYAHGFCFAVLCCGYTLTDFPTSIRLTSLALRQSNDCPSASKATLMNMDKYFMWIHYERLHNHNKAKHNKTLCTFLGIYCISMAVKKCLHFEDIKWCTCPWYILLAPESSYNQTTCNWSQSMLYVFTHWSRMFLCVCW